MVSHDDIMRLITVIDLHVVETGFPPDVQAAWWTLRAELRRTRRQSERVLPAVATAAQHVVLIKDHAEKALEALGAMTRSDTIRPPPPAEEPE